MRQDPDKTWLDYCQKLVDGLRSKQYENLRYQLRIALKKTSKEQVLEVFKTLVEDYSHHPQSDLL